MGRGYVVMTGEWLKTDKLRLVAVCLQLVHGTRTATAVRLRPGCRSQGPSATDHRSVCDCRRLAVEQALRETLADLRLELAVIEPRIC